MQVELIPFINKKAHIIHKHYILICMKFSQTKKKRTESMFLRCAREQQQKKKKKRQNKKTNRQQKAKTLSVRCHTNSVLIRIVYLNLKQLTVQQVLKNKPYVFGCIIYIQICIYLDDVYDVDEGCFQQLLLIALRKFENCGLKNLQQHWIKIKFKKKQKKKLCIEIEGRQVSLCFSISGSEWYAMFLHGVPIRKYYTYNSFEMG